MEIHHISSLSKALPGAPPLSGNGQKFEFTYAALRAIAKMGSDVYTLDFVAEEEENAAIIAAIKERAVASGDDGGDARPSTTSPPKSAGFSYANETAKARREVVSFLTKNATTTTSSAGPAAVVSSSSSVGAAAAAASPPTTQLLTSTVSKHFIVILPSSTTATIGASISPTLADLTDALSLVTGIHAKDLRMLFSPPCTHLSKIVAAPTPTATAAGEGATSNSRSEDPQPSSAPSKQLPAEVSLRAEKFGSMVRVTVSHRQKNENNNNNNSKNTSGKTNRESDNNVEDFVVELSATHLSSPTGSNPSSSVTAAAPSSLSSSSLSTKPHVMILGKQTRLGIVGEAVHYYLNSLAKPHSHAHAHHHAPHHPDSSKNKINNANTKGISVADTNNTNTSKVAHDGLEAAASVAFPTSSFPSGGSQTALKGDTLDEYAPDHVVIEQLLRQQNASWAKQVITNSAVMMRDVMDPQMSGGEEGASPEGGRTAEGEEEPDSSKDSKGGEADTRAKKKSRRELKQESSIRRQLNIAKAQQTALLDLIMTKIKNNKLLDQQQQPEQATSHISTEVDNSVRALVCDPLYVATVLGKRRPLSDGEVLAAARYWATVGDEDQTTYRRSKSGLVACHRLIMLDPFEHVFPDHSFVGSDKEGEENATFNSSRVDAAGIISRLYPTIASEEIFLRTSGSFSRVFWGHLVAEAAMGGAWAALFKLEKECKVAIQRVLDEFHGEARSIDDDRRKARVAASRLLKNSPNNTTAATQQGHQEEQNSETAEARELALKIRIQRAVAPILAKYAMDRGKDTVNCLRQQDQQQAAKGEGALEEEDTEDKQQSLLLQRRFNRTAKREMLKLLRLFGKSCTRAFRKLRDVDVREEELMRKEDMEEEERRKRIKKRNMEKKKKKEEKTGTNKKKNFTLEEPSQSGSGEDTSTNKKKGAKNSAAINKPEEIGDDAESSTKAKKRRTEPTAATSATVAAPLSWMAHAQPNKTSPFVATTDKGKRKEVVVVGGHHEDPPSSKGINSKKDKDKDNSEEDDDFDLDDEEYNENDDEFYEDFDIDAYMDDIANGDDDDDDDEEDDEEDDEVEYNFDGLMGDIKEGVLNHDYDARQFEDDYEGEEGDADEDDDDNYDYNDNDDDDDDADDAVLREYLQRGAPAALEALNSAYLQSIEEHKTEAGLNALETVAALHELILTRKFDDNPLAAGLNFKPLYESGKGNSAADTRMKKDVDVKSQLKEDQEDDSPIPGIGEWRVPLMLTCSHSLPMHAPRFSASCRTCVERGLTTAEHRLCAVCALTCHAGHTILWREATLEGPRPQQQQPPSMIVNNSGAPLISPFVCDCPTDAFKEYGLPRHATAISIAAVPEEECDENDETIIGNANSDIKQKQRGANNHNNNLLNVSSKTHYAHACRYFVIPELNECPLAKKEALLEGAMRIESLVNAAAAVSRIQVTEETTKAEDAENDSTNLTSSSKQSFESDVKGSARDVATTEEEEELMFKNSVNTVRKVIDDIRKVASVMLTRYPRERGNRYPGQRQLSSRVKAAERELLLCHKQQEKDRPNTQICTDMKNAKGNGIGDTTTITTTITTTTADLVTSSSALSSASLEAAANADAMSRMCYCNSSPKAFSSAQATQEGTFACPSPSNPPYALYQGVDALINTSLPTPQLPVLSTIVDRIAVETKGVLTSHLSVDADGGKGCASVLDKSTNCNKTSENAAENTVISCAGCNDLFSQDHLSALDGRHVKSMGCHGRLPSGKHAVAFRCRTCVYEPGVGSRAYLRERRVKERQQAYQQHVSQQEQQKRTASASAASGSSATKSGKSGRTSKLFSSFSSSTRPLRSATAPAASSEPLLSKSKIKKAAIEALDRLASHDANSETNTYNPYNLLIPSKVVTSLQKGLLVCAPCAFRCHLGQGHDVDLSTAYVYRSYASTLAGGGDEFKKKVMPEVKTDDGTINNSCTLPEEAAAATTLAGRGLTIGLDGVHENGNDHTSAQLWASMALCASKALTDETMAIEESVRDDCYHVKSRAPSEAECARINNPDKRKVTQSSLSSSSSGAVPPLPKAEERFLSTPTETIFFGKDEGECGIYSKLLLKDRERKQLEAFNETRMRAMQSPLQPMRDNATASATPFANQLPTYDANHLVGLNPSHIVDDGNEGDLRRITTFQNRPYRSPQQILALLGGQDDEVGRQMIAHEYVQRDFPTFGSSSSPATISAKNNTKSTDASGKPSFDDEEDLNDVEDPKYPFMVENSELEELSVLLDEALAAANSALLRTSPTSPQSGTSSASTAAKQAQNISHLRVVDGTHLMRAQNVVFAQAAKEGFVNRRLAAKKRYLSQYEKVENIHKPIRGGGAGSTLLSGLTNLASPNTSASAARSALADLLTNGERSADGKEILIRQDDEASMSALMGLLGGQGNIPPPPSMLHSDRSRQIEEMKEMYMETFSPQTIERVAAKKRKKRNKVRGTLEIDSKAAGKVSAGSHDANDNENESESDNGDLNGSKVIKGTRKGARSSGGGVKSPLSWRDEVPPPNVYALPDLYPDILTGNNEEFGDDYWTNFDGSQAGFVCGCQSAQLLEQFIRDQKLLQRRKVILPNHPSNTQVGGEGTTPPPLSGSTAGPSVVVVGNSPFVCQIGLVPTSASSNGQPLSCNGASSSSSSSGPSGPIPYSSIETSTTAEELLAMFSTSCAVPPVVGFGEGNDLANPRTAMLRAQQEVTHIGGDQRLTFESYQALQDSLFVSLMVLPDSDLNHLQKLLQNDEEMSGGDATGVGSSLVSKVLGFGVGCSRSANSAMNGNGTGDSGINDDKAFGVAGGSGAESTTLLGTPSSTTATSTACGGASHRFLFGPFAVPEQNYEDLWLADTRATTTHQGTKANLSSASPEALCFTNAQLRVLLSFDHQFRLFCNWCIEKQQSWVLDYKLSDCHVMKAILKHKRRRRVAGSNNDSAHQIMKTFCWPTCCGEQAVDGSDKRRFSDMSSTPCAQDDDEDTDTINTIDYYYYPYHGMVLPANPFSDRYVCTPATCCGRGLPLLTNLSLDPNGSSCYPPATSVLSPHMGGSLLALTQPSQSGTNGNGNNDNREDDADLLPSLAPVQSQRRLFSAEGRQVTATATYCQGFYDYLDPDRNGAIDSVFAAAAAASTSPAEVGQRADEKYDIEMAGIGIRGRLTSGCSSMLRDRGRAKGSADRDVQTTYVYELLEGVRDDWIDPLTCGKLVLRGSEAEEGSRRGSSNTPSSYVYVPNISKCKGNALGKNLQSEHHDERGYVVGEEEAIQRRAAHAGAFGSMLGGSKSQSALRLRSGAQVSTFRHHHTLEEAYMCSRFVPVNECKNCSCALPVACAFSCAFCAMPELVKMVATKKAAEEAVKKHVDRMKVDRQKRIAAAAESAKTHTQGNGATATAIGEEKSSRIGAKRPREEEEESAAEKKTVAGTREKNRKEDEVDANSNSEAAEGEEKEEEKEEAATNSSNNPQKQSAPESPSSSTSSIEEIDLEASDFDDEDEDDAHNNAGLSGMHGSERSKAKANVISIQVQREADEYDVDDTEEGKKSSEVRASSLVKDNNSNNGKKRIITETAHVTLPDLRSVMKTVTADELLEFLKSEALGAHADQLGMLLMMDSLRGAGGEEEVIFCPACSEKPFFEREVHSDIDHPLFPYLKVRQITLLRDAIAGDYMRGSFLGGGDATNILLGSADSDDPSSRAGGGETSTSRGGGAERGSSDAVVLHQPTNNSTATDMGSNQRKRRREGEGEGEEKEPLLLPSLPAPIPASAEAAAENKKQERLALINKMPQSDTAAWLSANRTGVPPPTPNSTLSANAEVYSSESVAFSASHMSLSAPAENATERSTTAATISNTSTSGVSAPNLSLPTASPSKKRNPGEEVHATRIAHLEKALKELRRVAKSVHGASSSSIDYAASLGRALAAYASEDASFLGTQIKVISSTSGEPSTHQQQHHQHQHQHQQQELPLSSSLSSSASVSTVSTSRPLINSSCPYLSPIERIAALRDVASLNKARRRVVLSYASARGASSSEHVITQEEQVGTEDLPQEGNRKSGTGPKDETK